MPTARELIESAMGKIQVLGASEAATADEATKGLYDLNAMLDAWSIERLMVYQVQQTTNSWGANVSSRTIGSGGNFNTTRPYKIADEGNFFRTSGNLDYQLTVYPRELYDRIVQKSAGGSIPEYLFVDPGFPTMTLYVYPVPSEALTLYLNHWKPLQSFAALTTDLSLPPGYQAAIEFNLGIWMAPRYGRAAKEAAADLKSQAGMLKAAIKGVNQPSTVAKIDPALVGAGGRRSRIESDS